MESSKTLKNGLITLLGQILTLLLQFINRRVFVLFLDIEYLGYHSVFGNIFTLLSVAELGIGEVISFHLYREIVTGNKREIGKLMYLYKWIYRVIATVVAVFGIIISVFIPYIVNDAKNSFKYLYIVYYIQLLSVVLGYCLSYRRTIFTADQKEYKNVEIDLFAYLLMQIVQIVVLAVFRNYIVYLSIQLSTSIVSNIIILIKTNKEYPFLKEKYNISKEDIDKRNLITDTKNIFIHRISYVIYGGTDNVIISMFCGIKNVALYGNYYTIHNGIYNQIIRKVLNSVQAAIGNVVYSSREKNELWNQFSVLTVFGTIMATYVCIGYIIFYQPIIFLWMGSEEYLLSDAFVVIYALTNYLLITSEVVYRYRSVFGNYKQDRGCMIISAILNIVISITFANPFGVVGVQIGSLISFVPIFYGRIRFVVGSFFGQSVKKYLLMHAGLFAVVIAEGTAVYLLTRNMPITVVGILIRFLVWGIVPLAINLLIYFRSPHFKDMCSYFVNLINILVQKIPGKIKNKDK